MVFQTLAMFVRSKGPDEFWRKRKIFKLSAHFSGRRRNCFSVAVRNVHRSLQYVAISRKLKKEDLSELWSTRIAAGCEQFGLADYAFRESLARNNILLNRKSLADLAVWEPKTFEALVRTCRERAVHDNLNGVSEPATDNQVFIDKTK